MGVQKFSILIIVGFDTEVYMLLGRLETDLSPAFFLFGSGYCCVLVLCLHALYHY